MPIPFSVVENAFDYVNSAGPGENAAYVARDTGEVYYTSEIGDSDELPEDFEDADDRYLEIPHGNDLDLGVDLVWEFVAAEVPHLADEVEIAMDGPGAYRRLKSLLRLKGQLAAWHAFEEERSAEALRQWCADNDVDLAQA